MAKLTQNQVNSNLERQRKVQERLVKKVENQTQRELLGENWKTILKQEQQKEFEMEFGASNTPKLYDFEDLYKFTDPINFYMDPDNKPLNMDYDAFQASQIKYQAALDKIDAELAYLRDPTDTPLISLSADGTSPADDFEPVDCTAADKGDEISIAIVNSKTPQARAKGRLNADLATYFNRSVPLYTKHVCSCCGQPLALKDFYIGYNIANASKIDAKGNHYLSVCKTCSQKLLMYYYTKRTDKNVELAMQYTCAALSIYWDVDLFYAAKKAFEDGGRKDTLLGTYIKTINEKEPGKTFVESPFLSDEQYSAKIREGLNTQIDDNPIEWSAQDVKNKKDIIKILGYDPFEFETDENEKKILYSDTCQVIDEEIAQDYVKLQSAITIVKSFAKVRKLDEKMAQMERDGAPLNDQKAVSDLKAKELKAISDFARDSGFSERFRTKQSSGLTSFTGIMKTMDEKKFENELINKYDVMTSSTIQAAADASIKAIFNQLNLSDAEVWKIANDQLEELTKLRRDYDRCQEELRKTKYQLAEVNLKQKAQEKGIDYD